MRNLLERSARKAEDKEKTGEEQAKGALAYPEAYEAYRPKVYVGDVFDWMEIHRRRGLAFDVGFLDEPYNVTTEKWDKKPFGDTETLAISRFVKAAMSSGGSFFHFLPEHRITAVREVYTKEGLYVYPTYIWIKRSPKMPQGRQVNGGTYYSREYFLHVREFRVTRLVRQPRSSMSVHR